MEEIEVLDLEDNKKTKKKNKIKRKLKKGEKLFLLINILIIFGIIGIYAYRLVYYYKQTHNVEVNVTLKDKLTAITNLSYQNDGLHEKDGYFYYKGSNVNNYVYYSGRLFRIVDISDGIRIILDDTTTNLIWGIDSKYSESTINQYLNNYLNTLSDYEVYLKENSWCNESVDIEKYNCKENINSYIGLLSTSDYLQAGGKNSFLNNGTFFWTINTDLSGNALYVNNTGSINNLSHNEDTYYSYGVRPVITLRDDISFLSGDGSKDNPYIIENLGKALLRDNSIGSFVKYNNDTYRIMMVENDGVTLIYNGILEVEKNYNDVMKYLNSDFLKRFKQEDLVKISNSTSEYNYSNKYDYTSNGSKNSNYVVIPKIGDLFLNDYGNYWLNNIADNKLGLNYVVDENKMLFADLKNNKHFIRPVIKLNSEMVVEKGVGTTLDPLIVGDNDVNEN